MSENKTVAPGEQSLTEQVQAAIQEGMNLQGEDFEAWKQQFIDERLSVLMGSAYKGEHTGLSKPAAEFFDSESEISPLFLGRGFLLDDSQIYHAFLDTMHRFSKAEHFNRSDKFAELRIYSIQYGIQAYFGNTVPSKEDQAKREERLWASAVLSIDDDGPEHLPRSIGENKSEALCAERAAVAHNLLLFSGVENYYYNGKLSIDDRVSEESHAYVLPKNSKGELLIYDPMNPLFVQNESGEFITLHPAVFPGGDEIMAGKDVSVDHHLFELKADERTVVKSSDKYTYHAHPLLGMMID